MTTETILSHDQILELIRKHENDFEHVRNVEQAVLQSEQVQAWKRDSERLDWLADPKNSIGDVQLPTVCVERNPHSLRDAIEDAMEQQHES